MEEKNECQHAHQHIDFFITGFGAFGSHKTNPTSKFIELININKSEFENKHVNI